MTRTLSAMISTTSLVLAGCGQAPTSTVAFDQPEFPLAVSCVRVVDRLAPLGETKVATKAMTSQSVAFRIENYPTACSTTFAAQTAFGPNTLSLQIRGENEERCLCTVEFQPFSVSLPTSVSWKAFQEFQFQLTRAGSTYAQASWTVRDLQGF